MQRSAMLMREGGWPSRWTGVGPSSPEACHEGLAGTLAGAYLSGIAAADAAIRALDQAG
ncbi:MAG: hypothetical protein JOY71_08720 [Acetobacteraceae bacterium]|nr:hypothetical protein [Acetobacteraceae bacterium]MBV8522194.1 hypothetical protein [Acetobacteraceae bacterium]MBV8592135.1 hypothetical protein [Acetobacteraceae bacterium]